MKKKRLKVLLIKLMIYKKENLQWVLMDKSIKSNNLVLVEEKEKIETCKLKTLLIKNLSKGTVHQELSNSQRSVRLK